MFVLILSCVMARCEMVADMRRGGGWRVVGVGGGESLPVSLCWF